MPRTPNVFKDPKKGTEWNWPVNHSEEGESGQARSVQDGAKSGLGIVPQQADDQPIIFKYTGTIFHKSQVQTMASWYKLCASQTINFKDFAGDEYEVLITALRPTRKRTIRNPRDFANAPLWYWTYEIEMRVIRVISGIWAGVL
jgi:hypothetical protein